MFRFGKTHFEIEVGAYWYYFNFCIMKWTLGDWWGCSNGWYLELRFGKPKWGCSWSWKLF